MKTTRWLPRLGGARSSAAVMAMAMAALLVTALPSAASVTDGHPTLAPATSEQSAFPTSLPAGALTPRQAANRIGQTKTVCGYVAGTKYARNVNGRPTFLNLGRVYPQQILNIVIWSEYRSRYPSAPERLFNGKTVCVRGRIGTYAGTPQIEARSSLVWVP